MESNLLIEVQINNHNGMQGFLQGFLVICSTLLIFTVFLNRFNQMSFYYLEVE